MNKMHFLTGSLFLGALLTAGGAHAVALSSLFAGGSLTVGDKTFDEWTIDNGGDFYNFSNLDLSTVEVTGIGDGSAGNEYGLAFSLTSPLTTTGDDFADVFFGFRVSASAGWLINGVSLSVEGSLTQGTGNNGYSVYEYIGADFTDVATQTPSIAELWAEQTWTADASGAFSLDGALQAQRFFGPRSEIFVGKNLLVFSTDSNDEASLTAFTQRFSQVQRSIPEPSSLMLLGIGLLGFFAPKLRKSSRHA